MRKVSRISNKKALKIQKSSNVRTVPIVAKHIASTVDTIQTHDNKFSTGDIAKLLATSNKIVLENAKKCLPNKRIENGKTTYWTKEEVTILVDWMNKNPNTNTNDLYVERKGVSTELTPALKIRQAMLLMKEGYDEELAIQKQRAEIAELTADNLRIELDEAKEWYSVKRMQKLNPTKDISSQIWRELKRESDSLGKEPVAVFDANYGKVNAYHKSVWESLFLDTIKY